jgi:signal recognition particle subunit SRP54
MMDKIPPEALDDRQLDRTLAIIQSMTHQERNFPEVLNTSRFRRIAKGCGRTQEEVEALHGRFEQARMMMKSMGNLMSDPNAMANMQKQMAAMQRGGGAGAAGFPGFPGFGGPPPKPELTVDEKLAKRQKQLEARRKKR